MNERIAKLYEEAGFPRFDIKNEAEKFAELIVKECANICYGFGESGDGYTCSAEVLEHFGVEE